MKKIILVLLFAIFAPTALAQQWGEGISVRMDSDAKDAVATVNAHKIHKVNGYRVCFFMDNGQNARDNAARALAQFRNFYSGTSAEVVYENPFFKVYAGRFLTRNEAYRLLGSLSNLFPRAVIAMESFDISIFEQDTEIEIFEDGDMPNSKATLDSLSTTITPNDIEE